MEASGGTHVCNIADASRYRMVVGNYSNLYLLIFVIFGGGGTDSIIVVADSITCYLMLAVKVAKFVALTIVFLFSHFFKIKSLKTIVFWGPSTAVERRTFTQFESLT